MLLFTFSISVSTDGVVLLTTIVPWKPYVNPNLDAAILTPQIKFPRMANVEENMDNVQKANAVVSMDGVVPAKNIVLITKIASQSLEIQSLLN